MRTHGFPFGGCYCCRLRLLRTSASDKMRCKRGVVLYIVLVVHTLGRCSSRRQFVGEVCDSLPSRTSASTVKFHRHSCCTGGEITHTAAHSSSSSSSQRRGTTSEEATRGGTPMVLDGEGTYENQVLEFGIRITKLRSKLPKINHDDAHNHRTQPNARWSFRIACWSFACRWPMELFLAIPTGNHPRRGERDRYDAQGPARK